MSRLEVVGAVKRSVWLLVAAAALSSITSASFSSAIILAAKPLAPAPNLAGAPYATYFVAFAAATLATARLAQSRGRRTALVWGQVCGFFGAALAAMGLLTGSFAELVAGGLLFGLAAGSATSMRLYAVELVEGDQALRAVSHIMGAGLIGAIVGPFLAMRGGEATTALTTAFVVQATLHLLTIGALGLLPTATTKGGSGPFRLRLNAGPRAVAAAFASALAWAVMIALMGTAPEQMHVHGVGGLAAITTMQSHFVAMFAPALLTPVLAKRLSRRQLFFGGVVSLIGAVASAAFADAWASFWLTLTLAGIGWGLIVVIASTVLAAEVTGPDKFATQGALDLIIYSSAAAAALGASWITSIADWTGVAATCGPLIAAYFVVFRDKAVAT